MIRIGMLTSGGDCQALNAAMRGVAKTMYNSREDVEIYGFLNGYQGLIYGRFRLLSYADFSGILTEGGTFLGSSRTPYKTIREPDENGLDKVAAMKQNYHKLQLDCLVILGGNGTHKTANLLREEGLNVVTLPKTIDKRPLGHGHDLWLPERRGRRYRRHRPHPHHRRLARPRVHRGGHGPQGRLAGRSTRAWPAAPTSS